MEPGPGPGSGAPPPGQPTIDSVPTTLYLVDPAGGRYPITSFPPSGAGPGVTLADWSGDGGHALLYTNMPGALRITTVDLHTGRQTAFAAEGGFSVIPHQPPQGTAVVLAKWHDTEPASLKRVDLVGKPESAYPVQSDFQGWYLSTPDGAELVMGMADGFGVDGQSRRSGRSSPAGTASRRGCGWFRATGWRSTTASRVIRRSAR